MDLNSIRQRSLNKAQELGFDINDELPSIDEVTNLKTADEIVRRLLCLNAIAACAYGFDKKTAESWLEEEDLFKDLTIREKSFVEEGKEDERRFQVQVEGLCALTWALNLVPDMDFAKDCDDEFVTILPNLKIGESSSAIRSRAILRDWTEIVAARDLAYCLHWAVRHSQLTRGRLPDKPQVFVIEERRRALEWILSEDLWDEVQLDT